jgi:capsular polysaccharide biosynthesis protein
MSEKNEKYRFDSMDLAVYIWKRKIPLLIITFIAGVISIIASLMITPRFKSSVVLFPTIQTSVSKSLLMTDYQWNFQAFGEEEQVETVLQILKSDKIRDKIIDRFNLMDHYGISPDEAHPLYKLHSYYEGNFSFKRTEYNSVVITVMDADAQLAADMANEITALVDTTFWDMKYIRAQKAYEYLEMEYDSVTRVVVTLNECIHSYNMKGVINYDRQVERLIEAYGKAINDRNEAAKKDIEKEIYKLGEYSSGFIQCWSQYTHEIARMDNTRTQMLQLKAEMDHRVPAVFVLDKAYPADKKAYPKKAIIVVISTLSAFILALLGFLFFDNFLKRIREAK